MAQSSLLPSGESTELIDNIRHLFDDRSGSPRIVQLAYSGKCHQTLDVLDHDTGVLTGGKALVPAAEEQIFNLVAHEFGRFARTVRLNDAYDIDKNCAILRDGELTMLLPTLEECRGGPHHIPIAAPHPDTLVPDSDKRP